MILNLKSEDNTSSRRKQGKRLLAVCETVKVELKNELNLLFATFETALEKANRSLLQFPVHSRSRTLEASIVQSYFAEVLLQNFSNKAFFGKYKRLILSAKGYLILFKKLDRKGYPMNIQTVKVQSILNQNQALDLFSESDYSDSPILYFGYEKNKIGENVNPRLVYIDDGDIKFTIGHDDIQLELSLTNETVVNNEQIEVRPKLKENNALKKAN